MLLQSFLLGSRHQHPLLSHEIQLKILLFNIPAEFVLLLLSSPKICLHHSTPPEPSAHRGSGYMGDSDGDRSDLLSRHHHCSVHPEHCCTSGADKVPHNGKQLIISQTACQNPQLAAGMTEIPHFMFHILL